MKMISMKPHTWLDSKGVLKAFEEASVKPLSAAAFLVERKMKLLLSVGGGAERHPSTPPAPPHAQTGNLRASITAAKVPATEAWVVGPTLQAPYGRIHEYGGVISSGRGIRKYPPRPFAFPALIACAKEFPGLFRNLPVARTPTGRRLNKRK